MKEFDTVVVNYTGKAITHLHLEDGSASEAANVARAACHNTESDYVERALYRN